MSVNHSCGSAQSDCYETCRTSSREEGVTTNGRRPRSRHFASPVPVGRRYRQTSCCIGHISRISVRTVCHSRVIYKRLYCLRGTYSSNEGLRGRALSGTHGRYLFSIPTLVTKIRSKKGHGFPCQRAVGLLGGSETKRHDWVS